MADTNTWLAGEIARDDERSIREGETAVEWYHNSRDEARAQIMPMARGLCAAKRKYPATQEFGNWLQESPYRKLGQTDRAALIKIGEHEETASQFIRTTSLISPETIWDAIKGLLPSSATSDDRNSTSNPPPVPKHLVSVGESSPPSPQRRLPPGVEPAVLFTPAAKPDLSSGSSHSADFGSAEFSGPSPR